MNCIETANDPARSLPDLQGLAEANLSPSAAAVRVALLSGLSTVEDFAAGIDKSKRTVDQWIADGMPTVYVGRTPYIPIAEARSWLLKPSQRNAAPRKPGRPSSRKAA